MRRWIYNLYRDIYLKRRRFICKYFPRLILAILLVFTVSFVIGQAQEENLLTNPGFEDGFDGSQVANGWESWVSDDEDAPDFQEAPTYLRATDASDNGLIPQIR